MTLPKLDTLTHTHTITLSDDIIVSFQLRPIPGIEYQGLVVEHADPDTGKTPFDNPDFAQAILAAGISAVYSSVESTPTDFTDQDANELWQQWPEWARWDIYTAVINYTTKGPGGNPFTTSKPKGNGEQ